MDSTTSTTSITPDADVVAFWTTRFARQRFLKVAHYFEWEGEKVGGQSYAGAGRTYCGEWLTRRTGDNVPAAKCETCLSVITIRTANGTATDTSKKG